MSATRPRRDARVLGSDEECPTPYRIVLSCSPRTQEHRVFNTLFRVCDTAARLATLNRGRHHSYKVWEIQVDVDRSSVRAPDTIARPHQRSELRRQSARSFHHRMPAARVYSRKGRCIRGLLHHSLLHGRQPDVRKVTNTALFRAPQRITQKPNGALQERPVSIRADAHDSRRITRP